MLQIHPSVRFAIEADDQYKAHECAEGRELTLSAAAAWNPCHHYIQLKNDYLQKSLALQLKTASPEIAAAKLH